MLEDVDDLSENVADEDDDDDDHDDEDSPPAVTGGPEAEPSERTGTVERVVEDAPDDPEDESLIREPA